MESKQRDSLFAGSGLREESRHVKISSGKKKKEQNHGWATSEGGVKETGSEKGGKRTDILKSRNRKGIGEKGQGIELVKRYPS